MKNKSDLQKQNRRVEQLEIKIDPSSGADNDRQNKNHNARLESLGPNTKRRGN
jgi:hypothetical protein